MLAKQFHKEYYGLKSKILNLSKKLDNTLISLSKKHPDFIIDYKNNKMIKANVIVEYSDIIEDFPIENKIEYLDKIENLIIKDQKKKQLTIFDDINYSE